jgi:uncharacterized protein YdbL (DUF1318 family)
MRSFVIGPLIAILCSPALAQSLQVSGAIAAGTIGERFDGYMGFAAPPSEELRRQVIAINIRRRSLYTQIATERGVTVQLVGLTTACTLFRQLPVGEAYMLADNVWRRRTAGPPPMPETCR